MADFRALILQRHRHLQWKVFDGLGAVLMILCGVCIFMFTLTVFCDVGTRTLGAPWLWLQQVTTAFFAWGVFLGMAAATRRNDHFYLTEITKRMTGAPRSAIEITNRVIVLIVSLLLLWFGWKNALLDLGSSRMPSLLPLTIYTAIVPAAGVLILLFTIEQLVNGWQHGFEGPEDRDDLPPVAVEGIVEGASAGPPQDRSLPLGGKARNAPRGLTYDCRRHPDSDGHPVPGVRLHGRARVVRADGRRVRRDRLHPGQPAVDGRPALPRHRFRDAARGAVLSAGRRAHGLVRRRPPDDPAVADAGRTPARRARAGGGAVQHVFCRDLG